MKICFICDEYPPARNGGIGRGIQTLARALARQGHTIRVIGNYAPCQGLSALEDDEGVAVFRLFSSESNGYLAEIRSRRTLFRIIAGWARTGEIEVVEVPDYHGPAAHWPRIPVPVVVRLHGTATLFAHLLKNELPRSTYYGERMTIRRADFISSPSAYALSATSELFPLSAKETTILFPMSPVPAACPQTERARGKVVYNGTLAERKGVIPLMRAWPVVKQQCPEAELHMYGKDTKLPNGASMRQHLLSLVTDDLNVTFHGHVPRPELDEAILNARVCVFPSFEETFGLAPVDAMASGCPTIFSKRCAGTEIIENGRSGALVEPTRSEEIAEAIIRILSDDSLAARYSEAGWRTARNRFSTDALLPKYESFFESCVGRFRANRADLRQPTPLGFA